MGYAGRRLAVSWTEHLYRYQYSVLCILYSVRSTVLGILHPAFCILYPALVLLCTGRFVATGTASIRCMHALTCIDVNGRARSGRHVQICAFACTSTYWDPCLLSPLSPIPAKTPVRESVGRYWVHTHPPTRIHPHASSTSSVRSLPHAICFIRPVLDGG